MQKRWVLKSKSEDNKINQLVDEMHIHPVLADLLVHRQIEDKAQAETFFNPSLEDLHHPFLMKDMDVAISRIERAIGQNEKILIYGDYDVDGTTAVSVVYSFFREFHSRIEFYIPDRYAEGYGISKLGIDYAAAHNFKLIIALDCGIKAIEEIDYANEKGIDFIIGDHHLPGEQIPNAVAILDPKRSDCNYPYKELTGCAIGFKILQAFILKNKMDVNLCYQYLDLVAVSIASDIAPITGENRILTHFGLAKLNSNPSCGLQALVDLSSNKNKIFSVNDIVFQIGPRINAAGRIDHAKDAVKLLITKSLHEAKEYSEIIDDQNNVRKDFDLRITEEALALIDQDMDLQQNKSTVLFKPDWHKGVIGIVASRLIEKYYRPTVILTETNDYIAGSCRSIIGFDIYEALQECAELLEQFGGHKYAAGLTMKRENVPAFQQKFEEVVARNITKDILTQDILIDSTLQLADIHRNFYKTLYQFEPFGPHNDAPVFVSEQVHLIGQAYAVGTNHLKFVIQQDHSAAIDCIGFGLAYHLEQINSGIAFDLCYSIEENIWRGKKNLQLNVKAIRY